MFLINRERAIDYLNTRKRLFVVDAFTGWNPENRFTVRIVCERAYHALFMSNTLITPTEEELSTFGEPVSVIYNAGAFSANRLTQGMTSKTSVDIDFTRGEMVILGTECAGEMKKGVFTYVNYRMPKAGILSMHRANRRRVRCRFSYSPGDYETDRRGGSVWRACGATGNDGSGIRL